MTTELVEALQRPFDAKDIEWRIGQCGEKKNGEIWAKALAYLTNRAVMNRLDEVFGLDGWKNEFRQMTIGESAGVLCGLSVKVDGEWITKWDGAQVSDMEPFKGGISDSQKRAAVQLGIGRYLYNLDATFVETSLTKGQGEWNYATTKDKKVFHWKTPALPAWALPQSTRKPAQPSSVISDGQANDILAMLRKYDFDEIRFLAWASKAAKFDVTVINQLPRNLFDKAKSLLEAEGQKVPA